MLQDRADVRVIVPDLERRSCDDDIATAFDSHVLRTCAPNDKGRCEPFWVTDLLAEVPRLTNLQALEIVGPTAGTERGERYAPWFRQVPLVQPFGVQEIVEQSVGNVKIVGEHEHLLSVHPA